MGQWIYEYKLQLMSLHMSDHILSVYQMAVEVSWKGRKTSDNTVLGLSTILL
jgi:hypothetical protein